jgi:cytidylate kinase
MNQSIDPRTLTNVITIDGPAGAGKSTLAKRIASELGYAFLDTGAMYRSATWWAIHNAVDMTDREALTESTHSIPLQMKNVDGSLIVQVDSIDVTREIRTPEITNAIKSLDGIPAVREKMVSLQRQIASQAPTVAEGRDMGTVVFPHAKAKIFLEASLEERTRRRARELEGKSIPFNIRELESEIHARDENDRNRAISPLKPAYDALIIDTSAMILDEAQAAIIAHVRKLS